MSGGPGGRLYPPSWVKDNVIIQGSVFSITDQPNYSMARGKRKAPNSAGMRASKKQRNVTTKQRKRSKRTKNVKRKSKRSKKSRKFKRTKLTKTIKGNIQSFIIEYADTQQVPVRPTTAGSDLVGQQCVYMFSGCGNSTGPGNNGSLGSLTNIQSMGAVIESQESPALGNQFTYCETKFQIIDGYSKMQLVNQSNSQATVHMFYCETRRDIPNVNNYRDPRYILGDGFIQRGFGSGNSNITAGNYDNELTPFDSHKFCGFFKIYKQERVIMDAGQNIIRVLRMRNKYIDTSYYDTPNVNGTSISGQNPMFIRRKGERWILFKISGQPADGGDANVTYTSPKIDMITSNHYNFMSINRQQPIITKATPGGFTGGTSTVTIMQDEAGVAVGQTSA